MADNRRIKNKIRGEKGRHFDYGMEDELAAAYDQRRLNELKAEGAIEGDWISTKPVMTATGNDFSREMAGKIVESGAEVTIGSNDTFEPLSIEDTIAEMKQYNFSEQVTRSMTFHGDALKAALGKASKPSTKSEDKNGEKAKDEAPNELDDFPEGFPPYAKIALKKIDKTYADIKDLDREKLIALDGIAAKSADDIVAFISNAKKSEETK